MSVKDPALNREREPVGAGVARERVFPARCTYDVKERAMVNDNKPFTPKPGVSYMEVPRCRSCRFFSPCTDPNLGLCSNGHIQIGYVKIDFGCNAYEAAADPLPPEILDDPKPRPLGVKDLLAYAGPLTPEEIETPLEHVTDGSPCWCDPMEVCAECIPDDATGHVTQACGHDGQNFIILHRRPS
jgi:hypothetical protein